VDVTTDAVDDDARAGAVAEASGADADAAGAPAPGVAAARGRPRLRYWIAAAVCVGAVAFLIFGGLAGNVVYYRTVPEALQMKADGDTGRFRLAGNVKPGTVVDTPDGVEFVVTDGVRDVTVVNRGDPPELFRDGAPVVCEGRWRGEVFASEEILIKHGAEYTPPSQGGPAPASAAAGPMVPAVAAAPA
jgi:cytochrome c-type biogenesis protein CcmE